MERFDTNLDFEFEGSKQSAFLAEATGRISVSGVQEKFPAVIDRGHIRLAGEGERSAFILKPAPWDQTLQDRKLIPVNENLTMQIASRVYGIRTAENTLCFTPKNKAVYITKRFDIARDGSKYLMEDFASVLGRKSGNASQQYKYSGSYLEIAEAIRRYVPAWSIDLEMFFKTVVFNYVYANGDAHLKNFSLMTVDGERRLAPAYDLINTGLHVNGDDFGLDGGLGTARSEVYVSTGHPCRKDFEIFAGVIGLRPVRYANVLDMFGQIPDTATEMISSSILPQKAKRLYRRIISEKTARFNR